MSFRSALAGSALAAILATSAQAQAPHSHAPGSTHTPGSAHAPGHAQTADEAQVRTVVTAYKDAMLG